MPRTRKSIANKASGGRLYRGRTPEQLRAERRERLLDAALDLFGKKGYGNAPIELICATARVATRHFYEQFDSREALLKALFDAISEQLAAEIATVLKDDSRNQAERVSDAVYVAVTCLLQDPRRARVFSVEVVGVSTAMENHRRQQLHQLARLFQEYASSLAKAGQLPERDYHLPAVALAGMLNELIVEWLIYDTGLTAGELAREAVILLRAMVTGARNYRATARPSAQAG